MRKIYGFLLLFCLGISLASCSKQSMPKYILNSFQRFEFSNPGINKPVDAWQFAWNELDSNVLGMAGTPKVDSEGNAYFISNSFTLYSITPDGRLRWKLPDYFGDRIEVTKEGIIVFGSKSLVCLSLDGKEKWSMKEYQGIKCKPLLGPDGMIYSSINNNIISLDSLGQLRWSYPVKSTDVYENFFVSGFFDQSSNFYCLFFEHDSSWNEVKYVIYSMTSTGILRWKKYFTHGTLIRDFIPDGFYMYDTFLLAFSQRNSATSPKLISAYNTEGSILWTYSEPRIGMYESPFTLNGESTFYIPFSSDKTYLQAINKNGNLLWERFMLGSKSTSPVIDDESHIYMGVNSTERFLYAFYADGASIWVKKQTNEKAFYDHSLQFGSNHTLYYGAKQQNILYCIKDGWQ